MYKFSNSRLTALGPLLGASLIVALWSPTAHAAEDEGQAKPAAPAAEPKTEAAPEEKPESTPAEESTEEAKPVEGGTEAAPAAPTEEQREAAKVAFEAGTKAFGEEDYATAVAEFKKAYEQVPSPHAEYWIARATDAADPENKNPSETVAAYSKFLSNPGAQHAGAERVTESQARVVELKKLLPAQIKLITVPEGATVTIDGKAHEGKTPLDVDLPAGAHKFEIALEGYESTVVEMDVQGGSAVEQEVTLSEEAPPPAPVEEKPAVVAPPPKKSMVPAAVTLGLGGAGLISGTLFGIMALGAKKDFEDNPTTDNADTAERNALISDMSFGIALTLGITGIVLLTTDDDEAAAESTRKRRMLVAPYANKRGGGLAGRFRF